MTTEILDNAFVEIDNNDVSSYVRSVTVSYSAELSDDTAMGDDTRSNKAGLKNWSIELELNQDYSASGLNSILFPLVASDFNVKIRPDAGAVSTSNPEFSGDGVLGENQQIGGSVGDVHTTSVSISPSKSGPNSSATLTRSTS